MVKHVFSPSMIAHVWASQTQDSATVKPTDGNPFGNGGSYGRSNNRSAYFEGAALYSYGSHYMTGLFIAPGVVLINSSKNSNTTNARRWEAERATSHLKQILAPDLQDLARAFTSESYGYTWNKDRSAGSRAVTLAEFVGGYFEKVADEITAESALAVCEALKLRPSIWTKAKATADKAEAARKAKAAERKAALELQEAREFAALTVADFMAMVPPDAASPDLGRYRQSKTYGFKAAEDFKRRVNVALRTARKAPRFPKAGIERLALHAAWMRTHFAGMDARVIAAARAEAISRFEAWKLDDSARPIPYAQSFEGWNDEIAAEIVAIGAARNAVVYAAAYTAWKDGTGPRPSAAHYLGEEFDAIRADENAELDALSAAYEAWTLDPASPRPASRLFLSGPLSERYGHDAWSKLSGAERHDAEAAKRAKAAEAFATWQAGGREPVPYAFRADAQGRAYMRRNGDNLETSQGASVPWDHAVKAFRFIKLCREHGRAFERNGRTVRVGHFTVDSIDAAGNMRAGCHAFSWDEIARLATAHGVFDVEASAEAVTDSH